MQVVTVALQESPNREKCRIDKYLRRYRNTEVMEYVRKMCFS